jgi:HEAT repeat protein
MVELRRAGLGLLLGFVLLVLNAFASWNSAPPEKTSGAREITRHISLLKAGGVQQKAAAAYWLGQQHLAAAPAVDPLVELLGDTSPVDAGQYRSTRIVAKLTLGEEAAAALVNIGHPSIEALIRVLKTSPVAEARKNAAWALGALHDTGATSKI